MKKLIPLTLLCALFALPAFAAAYKVIHVSEFEKLKEDKAHKTAIFDANNETTRRKDGTIPGSVLLTSYKEYALDVLPAEKDANVVFYCANTKCQASHTAADRAAEAGYKNVYVMGDGIEGWKKAGKPTAKF